MPLYYIEITETSSKTVCIKAASDDEAIEKAEKLYMNSKIVLYPDDHVETRFDDVTTMLEYVSEYMEKF